jgi:nucleotide-binding universal stress UspA family protein
MTPLRTEIENVDYERIVVPLDGSERAEAALPHAETLARATDAPLHLLRVVDTMPLTHLSLVGLGVEQAAVLAALEGIAAEEEAAADYLESMRQRLARRGLATTVEVRTGLVVSELLAAIRPRDLLVITTHGRTDIVRWFLGSVAEAVLRQSPAPALVLRSDEETF